MTTEVHTDPRPSNARITLISIAAAMGLGAGAQGVFGLLVAREYSESVVGGYYLGLSIVVLAGTIGRIGTELLALREGSPAWANGDRSEFAQVTRTFLRAASRGSVVTAVLVAGLSALVGVFAGSEAVLDSPEILFAAPALISMNLLTVSCSLLRAANQMVLSVALRYFAVFGPALGILLATSRLEVPAVSPMLIVFVTATAAAAVAYLRLRALCGGNGAIGDASFAPYRSSAFRLTTSSGLNMALSWSDRLILASIAGVASVGVYGVAWQLVLPFTLLLTLGGTVSGPTFSRLWASGDIARLESVARGVSSAMLLLAVATGGAILIVAGPVLDRLGGNYGTAESIIFVLILGQIVNVGSGPIGQLYVMTGHETVVLRVSAASALVSVLSIVALTFAFGATGTAAGVTAGFIAKNASLVLLARRHLHISPFVAMPRRHERPPRTSLAGLLVG